MADKSKHDVRKIALVFITLVVYCVVLIFNQFASRKIIFPNDVGSLSRQYPLDITPLPIVFPIIWLTIYLWQTSWIIYTFSFLFRRVAQDGSLAYRKIDLYNNGLYIAFILNNIGLIAWLFFWCYQFLEWSFVTLTFLTLCLYVAFYIALRAAYLYHEDLLRLELFCEIWATRVLVLNGLGFFLTWTTIASTLNMATYFTYDLGIDLTVATTTALLIVFAIMTIYFVMENFIWQKYLLYVFTPWVVVLVALVGSLLKNWNGTSPTRNNLISLMMLIFAVCYTVVKMVMFALYQTVCKPNVDRRESHKLLQAKETRSS